MDNFSNEDIEQALDEYIIFHNETIKSSTKYAPNGNNSAPIKSVKAAIIKEYFHPNNIPANIKGTNVKPIDTILVLIDKKRLITIAEAKSKPHIIIILIFFIKSPLEVLYH